MKAKNKYITSNKILLFGLTYLQKYLIYRPRIKELGITESHTPLFNSVFFEVRTKCTGTCSFCVASVQNEKRKDISMPKALYEKVIDELCLIDFSGIIAPYVNNDPLIYPFLYEFIRYARKKLPKAWIQILTNGKGMTVNKAEELIKSGLNELHINYYNDDFSIELPRTLIEVRDVLIPRLFKPHQFRVGDFPPFSEAFSCLKDRFVFNIVRRKQNETLTSRAGTAPNKNYLTGIPRGFCEYPFTQLNITADGKVAMCCSDFYFTNPMGNAKDENILSIWKGVKFKNVRKKLLNGQRDLMETCSNCDFNGVKKRPMLIEKILSFKNIYMKELYYL